MPEVDKLQKADLAIVYTEIGRGHPSYLDGIVDCLEKSYPDINFLKTNVFDLSSGNSLRAWKLVKKLYKLGARGGIITALYGLLRKGSGSGEGGILYNLLGNSLKKRLSDFSRPVVVAHPILAKILAGQNDVVYQHGELAVPDESIVDGCRKILVPLMETAQAFSDRGIAGDNILVSGQCIESGLVTMSKPAFANRLQRLSGDTPLTAALFSSGAYPPAHLRQLRLAAKSLYESGHRVFFFTGRSARVKSRAVGYLGNMNIGAASDPRGDSQLVVVGAEDRQAENRLVESVFEKFDIFLGPAHERTNWAVGLGLPQFILTPHIGSYAPLNAAISVNAGTAVEFGDDIKPENLGTVISNMRADGRLKAMCQAGFGRSQLTGFERCANIIAGLLDQS